MIVLLEDDPQRTSEIVASLTRRISLSEIIVFDNAPDLIAWLDDHLEDTVLLCLDHDLGPNRTRNDDVFDPGTGRDVADYLASRPPSCPVLIHTTNTLAAPGMIRVLEESGWKPVRVVPYNDLEWVHTAWLPEVWRLLSDGS